ncbi:MAG: alpha-ketoglutarate-dependent dioxygenase AlkB [Pseudomonadota bacterium]
MSLELFDEPQALPMPDAEVLYWPQPPLDIDAGETLAQLVDETQWRQDDVKIFGKTYAQPRLHAWHGDADSQYTYSGLTLQPEPWTPLLQTLRNAVSKVSGASFNSVLLNLYRDGRDSMGMHADDERELGPNPVIASLSFGEERVLTFKHRQRRELESVKLPLGHGSLLLMRGATQHHWKHGIAKLSRSCGPRLNLTFRQVNP